ncbi:MAG: Hpt domain-containing protein [Bacteroidota bacterium]
MNQVDRTRQETRDTSVDLTYLSEITGGDQDFMNSIITTFVNETPKTIDKLLESSSQSDWWGVGQAAHQLKPSLQFIGLHHTLRQVKAIERNCKESIELTAIPSMVDSVVQDIQQSIIELKTELSM